MELDDILHPILIGYTFVWADMTLRFFLPIFFSTGAFFNASIDPPFKESTDNALSTCIHSNMYSLFIITEHWLILVILYNSQMFESVLCYRSLIPPPSLETVRRNWIVVRTFLFVAEGFTLL